jgi:hypothetical protein
VARAATLTRRATPSDTNAADLPAEHASATPGCRYTYLGGNSWFAEFGVSNVKVLCDPWLVGDLTFWDLPELYTGRKASLPEGNDWMARAGTADVILLSQGWEDHAHKPTLRALPKDIPVVGSPAAAEVARELGFTNVTGLRANAQFSIDASTRTGYAGTFGGGERKTKNESLTIVVTEGASVGPPWSPREAGFFLADGKGGVRLYYEPHCSYSPESVRAGLRAVGGRIDACVTPIKSVDVLGFALVSGGGAAVDLLECLGSPKRVLTLRNGELKQEGMSVRVLGTDGTTGEVFAKLCNARFGAGNTQIEMPTPGKTIVI